MQRIVTMPADLTADALDDLKGWLGISRPHEDAMLTDLLAASAALCEAFTGQMPIEQTVEETITASAGPHALTSRPVRALVGVQQIAADGTRSDLPASAYDLRIDALQTACITLDAPLNENAVAITLRVGISPDWATLPGALKQGMIRLAAFHYRDRETGRDAMPPASVAALWRPWRIVRLT